MCRMVSFEILRKNERMEEEEAMRLERREST